MFECIYTHLVVTNLNLINFQMFTQVNDEQKRDLKAKMEMKWSNPFMISIPLPLTIILSHQAINTFLQSFR